MKISSTIKEEHSSTDIKELFLKYSKEYSNVFIEDFGESGTFIYHSLGRKDYRTLTENGEISICDKEEIICESCVLYPQDFDFETCDEAGLPTALAKNILKNSLLDSATGLDKTIRYFRNKLMNSLDDQITCTIHEAFPEFTIEDIANWDIAKTAEYMTRAEYILHNLRGVPLSPVQEEPATTPDQYPRQVQDELKTQEIDVPSDKPVNKKAKLTPQKMAELKAKFPEIDWENDNGRVGQTGLLNTDVDTRNFGERNLDGSEDGQNAIPEALRNRFKVISENEVKDDND